MLNKEKEVTVGIACDGYSFTIGDKRFWFSQEEEEPEKLWKEIFKELGFDITVEEEY